MGPRHHQHLVPGRGCHRGGRAGHRLGGDHTRSLLAHGSGLDPALLSGYQLAFRIGRAGCVVVALLAALVMLREPDGPEAVSDPAVEAEAALDVSAAS